MTQIDRRTIAKGAAWTIPVLAFGVAAPSASASVILPPVDTNPCTNGTLTLTFEDQNEWNGKNLPQAIAITNNTDVTKIINGEVQNVSGHLVGLEGATTFTPDPQKKGDAAYSVTIPAHGTVYLRILVETDSDNSVGFLTLPDCSLRKQMKTVGFKDRDNIEGNGK
jgi:hypothetical protein